MITGHTKLVCLLGDPVEHSISPMMHNEAFSQLGIDCCYMAFGVGEKELPKVVDALKHMQVLGFNLTMPNKIKVCELCDELTPAVRLGQAANTVINRDGRLIAYTTDGIGFMDACKASGYDIIGKKMTILGAGGAAKAIMIQAALDGVETISVFSRNGRHWEDAERLIYRLNQETSCRVLHFDYSNPQDLKRELRDSAILVNATSVGMAPREDECLIPDESYFHKELIVYDVIYNPKETKLMKMAQKAGCRVSNGLYMLLYQGAAAFELWTGKKMPIDIVKEKYFTEMS